MMCTDTAGASKMIGVSRVTIWTWRETGRLTQIHRGSKILIPLRDIAKIMGVTQKELLSIADSKGANVWQVKV